MSLSRQRGPDPGRSFNLSGPQGRTFEPQGVSLEYALLEGVNQSEEPDAEVLEIDANTASADVVMWSEGASRRSSFGGFVTLDLF